MPKNIELMKKVLKQIEDHPETWEQRSWRCETGLCFAGWTAELSGAKWDDPKDPLDPYVVVGDDVVHVSSYARKALGLTGDEAEELFSGFNRLRHLREIVAEFEKEAAREAA